MRNALGWLVLVFLAALASMGLAMCEAARIQQGFAP